MFRCVQIMGMLALVFGCLVGVQTARADATMLSKVLPASLGEFVLRAGYDRELDGIPADQLQEVLDAEPGSVAIIHALQSDAYHTFGGPVTLCGIIDSGTGNEPLEALLLAGTKVILDDDTEVPFGGQLAVGNVIKLGVVFNAGETDVVLETGSGELLRMAPGAVIAALGAACAKSCSTECDPGYYACCYSDNKACFHCPCVKNGTEADCDLAGGPGTRKCTAGPQS